jgi:DNA-binding NtrC family response regulator
VRELENAIERAVVMSGAELLSPEAFALEELPSQTTPAHAIVAELLEPQPAKAVENLQEYLDRAATSKITAALDTANGSRAGAASALGVDRTTLYRLMKRLNLQ